MKFIAPKTVKTGPKKLEMIQGSKSEIERDTKTIPKKWLGYSNASKEYIELANTWVCQNFEEPYLRQVICSTGKQNPFIQVPPGDNKSHTKLKPTTEPKIRFNQESRERTCMVYSILDVISGTEFRFPTEFRYESADSDRILVPDGFFNGF